MASEKPFATEAEMCAAFLALVGPDWTSYAETAGWDILLVRNADGFQVGIQAKLRLNGHVLAQAVEQYHDRCGPDCRAVLVPAGADGALSTVAEFCGITVITISPKTHYYVRERFSPELPTKTGRVWWGEHWFEAGPLKRCPLPEYVPDVTAGAPAPIQLTDWKVKALKVAALLELTGYVTRADFKALNLDIRRWIVWGAHWLKPVSGSETDAIGMPAFAADYALPDFQKQHPDVFAKVLADAPKWGPRVRPGWEPKVVAPQQTILTPVTYLALQQQLITASPTHCRALLDLERGAALPAEHADADLGAMVDQVPVIAKAVANREATVRYFLGAAIAAGLLGFAAPADGSHGAPNQGVAA
ncbi:hypothetical protein [Azospirillum himalayense]|uniref:Restriction endonuclease n=1 Tax=Azospirillum himalayense TaxID=654847 RepID=A0ABW0GBM2_9PROT